MSFAVSFGLALAVGYALAAAGVVETPLLIAIILSAAALGTIIPLLKDAGESSTQFGQLVIGAASVADFGTIILLSLFFSREAPTPGRESSCCSGSRSSPWRLWPRSCA